MAFTPTAPEEIAPARPAQTASVYRIRKLSLDMGEADGSIPPVFEITVAQGNVADGVFQPVSRERFEITELAEIGALMATVPLADESLSQTTERAAWDYLLAEGFVPAGSIEV